VKYSAKLDLSAKVITLLVFLLLATVSLLILSFEPAQATSWFKWLTYPIAISLLAFPLIVFAYAPISYEVSNETFIVHRLISDITIPIKDILKVDYLNASFVQDFERTGGNGGVFGYFGEFTAGGRDTYHLYCTKMKGTILITTKDERLIVSPDDYGLVKVLRGMIQPGVIA
jgi:hypothetical protein